MHNGRTKTEENELKKTKSFGWKGGRRGEKGGREKGGRGKRGGSPPVKNISRIIRNQLDIE